MSKKLTPLEWLRYYERIVRESNQTFRPNGLKVIETALKENEKLKECYENELKNTAYYNNLALKYKKALEIIKEKILDMDYFNIIADRCDLTYQEYELLREVLKWQKKNTKITFTKKPKQ